MPSVTPTTANRGQQAALCTPTTSTHGPQHRMTQTQTVSHMPTIQPARYRQSRTMKAPARISALAVAILAGALSVAAVNCQSDPEPTPTTVPTTAPTATEAYIPPTLTPTRTPISEPTATQTPQPAATATPTSTPTTAPEGADIGQINATVDFDSLAKQSVQQQEGNDRLYDVSLHVINSPDSRRITLQLFCRTPSEPRRKCADEWEIGPGTPNRAAHHRQATRRRTPNHRRTQRITGHNRARFRRPRIRRRPRLSMGRSGVPKRAPVIPRTDKRDHPLVVRKLRR